MDTIFRDLTDKCFDYVQNIYRHLHQNPELSFQEVNTSNFIQTELKKMGIPFRAGIAKTGVLGKIEGKNPEKKIIALRADMDALPICEQTNLPFKSVNNNVMHACGHDVHVTCLLGAAKILEQLKDNFEGTILLIFQPGEEKAPGGANLMLNDGIFDELEPELIIGQHVSVDFFTGEMAFLTGKIMASADEIYIKIKGQGGHGALPHICNDTVLAASQTIVSLQQLASRLCPPKIPMVLTFGKFIANGATNVIPNEVDLSGTFRTLDETWREEAKNHIKRIITQTCGAYGCTAEINIPEGYPCVINDEKITQEATLYAQNFAGNENVKQFELRMTSEDFGFFSQKYPSCFYRFGVKRRDNSNISGLHTPTFEIDEEALKTGTGGLAWIAYNFLAAD